MFGRPDDGGAPFSPDGMFSTSSPSSALVGADGDEGEFFAEPESPLPTTLFTTNGNKFNTRRKRASLFDSDEEEEEENDKKGTKEVARDSNESQSAGVNDSIDEVELEKVLAAFSPDDDTRKDSIAGDGGFLFTSSMRVSEDDFDRQLFGVSKLSRSSALFADEDDEDEQPQEDAAHTAQHVDVLVEKTYDVIKISKTGESKQRRLKLLESEFQSLNPNDGSVHKSVSYRDVFCITANSQSISISLTSDTDMSFQTPSARELSHELNLRLSRSRRVELEATSSQAASTSTVGGSQHATNYQQRLFAEDRSNASASEPTLFFSPQFSSAQATPNRVVRTPVTTNPLSPSASANDVDASTAAIAAKSSSSSSASASSSSAPPLTRPAVSGTNSIVASSGGTPSTAAASSPANVVAAVSNHVAPAPNSSSQSSTNNAALRDEAYANWQRQYLLDQRVQLLIDHVWLDQSSKSVSEESKARAKFLKAFPNMEKDRKTLLRATRKFLDSFARYIEKKRMATLQSTIVGSGMLTGEVFESSWHQRVERSAQVAVLMPVMNKLLAVAASESADGDAIVFNQCTLLKGKPQTYFGIPEKNWSPSNW